MSNIQKYTLIMMISVFASSASQILLKKSALKTYKNKLQEYLNPFVSVSYGIFFLSTLITVFCLKYIPLSLAPVIESTGYIFVSVLGYTFLKEKFTFRKIVGMFVMIIGVLVYSFI